MHFANTEAMTYGLLIAVMIVAMIGYWIWKQRLKKQLGHLPMIEAMSDEHSARRQIASGVFVILGALCMLVALIQPQWGQTDRVIKRTGIDGDGTVLGQFEASGIRSHYAERFATWGYDLPAEIYAPNRKLG